MWTFSPPRVPLTCHIPSFFVSPSSSFLFLFAFSWTKNQIIKKSLRFLTNSKIDIVRIIPYFGTFTTGFRILRAKVSINQHECPGTTFESLWESPSLLEVTFILPAINDQTRLADIVSTVQESLGKQLYFLLGIQFKHGVVFEDESMRNINMTSRRLGLYFAYLSITYVTTPFFFSYLHSHVWCSTNVISTYSWPCSDGLIFKSWEWRRGGGETEICQNDLMKRSQLRVITHSYVAQHLGLTCMVTFVVWVGWHSRFSSPQQPAHLTRGTQEGL